VISKSVNMRCVEIPEMSFSGQHRMQLLITTYQEVKIPFDHTHVAMTKMCGLVIILVCQSDTFINSQEKN